MPVGADVLNFLSPLRVVQNPGDPEQADIDLGGDWAANTVLAGPASGPAAEPDPRPLVSGDIPDPLAVSLSKIFSAVNQPFLAGSIAGDIVARFSVDSDGTVVFSDGTPVGLVALYWIAANKLGLASGDIFQSGTAEHDTINEKTPAAGVTVDGVLVKDGLVDGIDVSTLPSEIDSDIATHAAEPDAHHVNDNDPTASEKAALAGTSGVPSGINKYVTDADPRNSDARIPTQHGNEYHTPDFAVATHTHDLPIYIPFGSNLLGQELISGITKYVMYSADVLLLQGG